MKALLPLNAHLVEDGTRRDAKRAMVLLLLDLIGGSAVVGAVVAALAFGFVFQQILREMKRLAD